MSLLTAPYNNSMRLGQGFNSYTQQICVNEAVKVTHPPEKDVYPSQIVTYSSRYVDKISDITNSMNISGALNIKYGMIGGGASGSFVDTDKFMESDLNFLVTVKVINQTIQADPEAMIFAPLTTQGVAASAPMDPQTFTNKFGDCFISGFHEGGEFYGLISIKVLNTTKKKKIVAEAHVSLQAGFGPSNLEVDGNASVNLSESNWQKNCETTITVNWSGGGQLKEGVEKWDVETLAEVAVRFPDMVAQTPQRILAILTKYNYLRSYLESQPTDLMPLVYDNAYIYTTELMDSYMAYKQIWKNIHITLDEFDSGAAGSRKLKEAHMAGVQDPLNNQVMIGPFKPDIMGLDLGIRACRLQMIRIVNEVDLITKDPSVATDPNHVSPYVRPQIFKHVLPAGCCDPYSPLDGISVPGGCCDPYSPLVTPPWIVYEAPDNLFDTQFSFLADHLDFLTSNKLKLSPLKGNFGANDTVSSNLTEIDPTLFDDGRPPIVTEIGYDIPYSPASFYANYQSQNTVGPTVDHTAVGTEIIGTPPQRKSHFFSLTSPEPNYIDEVVFVTAQSHPSTFWFPTFAEFNTKTQDPATRYKAQPWNSSRVYTAPDGCGLVGFWGTQAEDGSLTGIGCVWGEAERWFLRAKRS